MAPIYACPVCLRADLAEITADLLRGLSQRKVANKYGLWRSALQRHLAHPKAGPKVPPKVRLAIAQAELAALPTRAELAMELRGILDETHAVLARLKAGEVAGVAGVKLTLEALRDLVAGIERLGKVSGVFTDAPTVNMRSHLEMNVGVAIGQLANALEVRMVEINLSPETRTTLLDVFQVNDPAPGQTSGMAA